MSGLIQRLLDRSAPATAGPPPVHSAARSASPMAEHDQRLQDSGWRGVIGLSMPFGPFEGSVHETGPIESGFDRPLPDRLRRPSPRAPFSPAPDTEYPPVERPVDIPDRTRDAVPPQPPFDPIAALRRRDAGKAEISDSGDLPRKAPADRSVPDVQARPRATPPADHDRSTEAVRSEPSAGPLPQVQMSPPPQIRQPEAPQIITRDLPTDMPQTQTVTAAQPKPAPADRESPKPAEPARRAEAEPEPVRPAQRRSPAEFATPNGLLAPETRTETRERVIEKIVRENAVMAEKEPPVRSGALTAHSVSKIGALPTRRRAHTIFGLRRG